MPTLENYINWTRAENALPAGLYRRQVREVCTDSRKARKGTLFVALETDRDDGHAYVAKALSAGALAALVRKKKVASLPSRWHSRLLAVADPLKALQKAARVYRREMGLLLIGITGSNGKTTARHFLTSVLSRSFEVGATRGNWNNHIGVPLSLLSFSGNEWIGVIEMGANHNGEIGTLSRIARPDIVLLTNIGYGHIGMFGSLQVTTRVKFEILEGLNPHKGLVIINGDDPRLVGYVNRKKLPAVRFGFGQRCKIRARAYRQYGDGHQVFLVNGERYTLQMPGRHFVYAALPAIFMGIRCGMEPARIAAALADIAPVTLRGDIIERNGIRIIQDCYNANPSSMQSALNVLESIAPSRRRVACVGDMAELGKYTHRHHRLLGRRLVLAGVNRLCAAGQYASLVADAAYGEGMPRKRIRVASNAESAAVLLKAQLKKGDTVLIKGSRSIGLETVARALAEKGAV